MTPFEIALAINNRPDKDEPADAFALRVFAKEKMSDFGRALELLIGWERAEDDVFQIFTILTDKVKKAKEGATTVHELIARKRALGYNAKLEALLARKWRCPHCKQYATIETIRISVGNPSRLCQCTTCGEEGIAPISDEPKLKVREGGKTGLRPT